MSSEGQRRTPFTRGETSRLAVVRETTVTITAEHRGHERLDRARLADRVSDDVVLCTIETIAPLPRRELAVWEPDLPPSARAALVHWASTTWNFRLWFIDEVHDLPQPAVLGEDGHFAVWGAGVVCPTCGLQNWAHDSLFWHQVRVNGMFNTTCFACSALVPQWRVKADVPPSQALPVVEDTPAS